MVKIIAFSQLITTYSSILGILKKKDFFLWKLHIIYIIT